MCVRAALSVLGPGAQDALPERPHPVEPIPISQHGQVTNAATQLICALLLGLTCLGRAAKRGRSSTFA